ncbi:MAG: phosphosulfolactate synthase [Flavobacteriales bacterium]|nr:phosphosulfolactate synthase [Flavobacteriales bacterium]
MNYELSFIPDRTVKPRKSGLNMIMDKGLSTREAENLVENCADLIDFIKLGFGTSFVSNNLEIKIKLFHEAGIKVYLGGTLFEAFLIRDALDNYLKVLDKFGLTTMEISDGSIVLDHDKKCELIARLSKNYTVLSEVGSKEEGIFISPGKWISMMKTELQAGSFKVIGEARESGTVGIYRPNGTAHTMLINKILAAVDKDDIIWEAPKKPQQVWFIKQLGANVNLGNIGPEEVIPLETLRLGLRGDTFFTFLPEQLVEKHEG